MWPENLEEICDAVWEGDIDLWTELSPADVLYLREAFHSDPTEE